MPNFIEPDDTRYDERSRALISIGRVAIAQENPAALREVLQSGLRVPQPRRETPIFTGLETFFRQMRDAFSGFYCERYEIVSSGSLVGCRTEMGGTFNAPFDPTPFGTVEPHGGTVTLTLINMFRYDDEGRLAEEWVRVRQPRVDAPARRRTHSRVLELDDGQRCWSIETSSAAALLSRVAGAAAAGRSPLGSYRCTETFVIWGGARGDRDVQHEAAGHRECSWWTWLPWAVHQAARGRPVIVPGSMSVVARGRVPVASGVAGSLR